MGFAPKNYDPTKTESGGNSRYFRIKKGEGVRKVRILSDSFEYYAYWTTDRKKVVLQSMPDELPMDIKDGDRVNLTWAVVVLDRGDNKIKIWEITQKTIRMALVELSEDEDFGHPCYYDIKIKRSDESDKTSYLVTPAPRTPIDGVTMNLLMANPINLNGMLTGDDPFKGPHSHLPAELGVGQAPQPPAAPQYAPPAPMTPPAFSAPSAPAAPPIMHQPAVPGEGMTNRAILIDINKRHIHLEMTDLGVVIPLATSKLSKILGRAIAQADDLGPGEFAQLVDLFLIGWADQVRIEPEGALPTMLYPDGSEASYRNLIALYQDPTHWRKAEAWAIEVDRAKKSAEAIANPQQSLPMPAPGEPPNYDTIPF